MTCAKGHPISVHYRNTDAYEPWGSDKTSTAVHGYVHSIRCKSMSSVSLKQDEAWHLSELKRGANASSISVSALFATSSTASCLLAFGLVATIIANEPYPSVMHVKASVLSVDLALAVNSSVHLVAR